LRFPSPRSYRKEHEEGAKFAKPHQGPQTKKEEKARLEASFFALCGEFLNIDPEMIDAPEEHAA
jgi:hypothetical protein